VRRYAELEPVLAGPSRVVVARGILVSTAELVMTAVVAMAAGLGGSITHTGLFFLPALLVEIVASAKLWRERGEPAASG